MGAMQPWEVSYEYQRTINQLRDDVRRLEARNGYLSRVVTHQARLLRAWKRAYHYRRRT